MISLTRRRTEEELVAPTSLEAFLTQTGRPVPYKNPVLCFVKETWTKTHVMIKARPYFTPKASVWFNKKLLIDKKKTIWWEKWANSGIHFLEDLVKENKIRSFDEFKKKYDLSQQDFWKLLQIRHCSLATKKNNLDPLTEIQELFRVAWWKKGGKISNPPLERRLLGYPQELVPVWENSPGGYSHKRIALWT